MAVFESDFGVGFRLIENFDAFFASVFDGAVNELDEPAGPFVVDGADGDAGPAVAIVVATDQIIYGIEGGFAHHAVFESDGDGG